MLCQAAELEHGIMCQYLFAAFSLKQSTDEGLSDPSWRRHTLARTILHVATEEMLHLALVHNLLSAIGAAPHFARPNPPAPAHHYPPGVNLTLSRSASRRCGTSSSSSVLRGWSWRARPGSTLPIQEAAPLMAEGDIVPELQDFATVGHSYRSIEQGSPIWPKGSANAAVRRPSARARRRPRTSTGPSSCRHRRRVRAAGDRHDPRAGRGRRGDWQHAHFGQFVEILDEYREMRDQNPGFAPARPVLFATVRPGERDEGMPLIGDGSPRAAPISSTSATRSCCRRSSATSRIPRNPTRSSRRWPRRRSRSCSACSNPSAA